MKFSLFVFPFLATAEVERFLLRKNSDGVYGFTIQTKAKRRHFVTDILPNSQAEKVGLRDGWKITDVNGYVIQCFCRNRRTYRPFRRFVIKFKGTVGSLVVISSSLISVTH